MSEDAPASWTATMAECSSCGCAVLEWALTVTSDAGVTDAGSVVICGRCEE